MATSTTNYSFTLPEVGGDTDQWGSQLNANWTLADSTLKTIEDSVGDDVTLTGNDYLTISGQAITVGDVDLTTDVTGTLPVASGGTGLAALGSANQVLAVNATADGLEFQTVSGSGTVTSVAITGADGIEIDSGSPISSSGTIALGINSTTLSTHLGLGSLATQSSVTESQISDLGSYITASSTDTLTNKSGNISQWTNDANYITAESNDLSAAVTWANVPDGNITESSVTQHQAALSITESQISDLQSYLTAEANDLSSSVTWANVPDANITQSSVTQHEAALTITESQISDLCSYQPSDAGLTSIAGLTTTANKMLYTTAADTYAVTALTTAGRALLDDADAAAQRITLGLGTAATSNTSAFEAAGSVSTHAALTEVHGISAFGATLVDDADAPAARTTLGLGSLATQSTITESQISDLQSYLTAEVNDLGTAVTGTLGIGNGGTGLTALGSAGQVLTVNSGANALEYQTPLVALPITDSAGNNVLSESGSVVTLTADTAVIEGSSSGDLVRITQTGTGNAIVVEDETNPDSTPFVVTNDGKVGIGCSPSQKLQVQSTGGTILSIKDVTSGSGDYSNIWFGDESAEYAGFLGYNHSTDAMTFGTSATERMRIDSSGNLLVGYTSSNGSYKLQVNSQIYATSSTIATSDFNYKENITPLDGALSLVSQLNPVQFDWKEHSIHEFDRNQPTIGFIAQEVQQVLGEQPYLNSIVKSNECVLEPEETDQEGNVIKEAVTEEFLGIAESNLVALLTKAIQEQQTLIESQQSQIDALTARIEALENT